MKNSTFFKIFDFVLMVSLLASCVGVEDSDPSSVSVPEVRTFEVNDNGSLVFELTASVDKNAVGRIASCGFYYGKKHDMSDAERIECKLMGGTFITDLTLREYGETFYVCSYISNGLGSSEIRSELKTIFVGELGDYVTFNTPAVSYDLKYKYVKVGISYNVQKGVEVSRCGLCYGDSRDLSISGDHSEEEDFTAGYINVRISDVEPGKAYYVRPYLYDGDEFVYGPVEEICVLSDLAAAGTANCYIVSEPGCYEFPAVKGNGNASVGTVASVEVLWESFGTSTTPKVGDLVQSVSYSSGTILFQTADAFREGNAVIAAKRSNGKILWSWHIWLTDEPQEQVYYNDAGTMMDRNLGATSATPGDVGALGLLYQWGRKDPFLGSSSISTEVEAKSTIIWPSPVQSSASYGTITYSIEHPTTFITPNDNNYDWYYTGSYSTDDTRWMTSEVAKSIYDPCPAGWRVPDGGDNGIWSKAEFVDATYDSINEGIISFAVSSPSPTWYPASGYRFHYEGSLGDVGYSGSYWSASPYDVHAYHLFLERSGYVDWKASFIRADGYSVRCVKE